MKRLLIGLFLLLVVAAVVAKFLLFDFPRIGGDEMAPALHPGDWVVVYRGRKLPRRGDLVLFEHPQRNIVLVRRVVGLPGERVSVRREVLRIDGKPVTRRVLRETGAGQQRMRVVEERVGALRYEVLKDPGRRSVDPKPIKLDGAYYVMADNRNHGTDSRTFGPVPASRILGVVVHRFGD